MSKTKQLFFILLLIFLGTWGALIGSIYFASNKSDIGQADAIVVLGTRQTEGIPSSVFKARLDHAYDLYSSRMAPLVITTGGIGKEENISEAEAGKEYLHNKGIKGTVILMEDKGRTTWQSLNNIVPIIQNRKIDKIILVGDDFHTLRLRAMAHELRLNAIVSPVTNGPIQQNPSIEAKYIFRESWIYILFKIFKV